MRGMPYVKPPVCQRPVGTSFCHRKAGHQDDCLGTPTVAEVLDFEAANPSHDDRKEELIRTRFDLPKVRYYQLLNLYVNGTAALEHDPMTSNRARTTRDDRAAARAARTPIR